MGKTLDEGGRELRIKALEAVTKHIQERYTDQAEIMHPKLQGKELDVATAVLPRFGGHPDTCMGEFCFKPIPEDPEGGQYFISLITLQNDIPVENVPELAFALSIMNFYIEAGCFALNKPTDLLVYRGTRAFAGDTPEEVLIKDCILEMEEAYDIAARYAAPLLDLAEGAMELTKFLEIVKTV